MALRAERTTVLLIGGAMVTHRFGVVGAAVLLAALGAGYGIYKTQLADEHTDVIAVENPTFVAEDLPAYQDQDIVFRVHNGGKEARRIVGCPRL
jgi:hypothetical protein